MALDLESAVAGAFGELGGAVEGMLRKFLSMFKNIKPPALEDASLHHALSLAIGACGAGCRGATQELLALIPVPDPEETRSG